MEDEKQGLKEELGQALRRSGATLALEVGRQLFSRGDYIRIERQTLDSLSAKNGRQRLEIYEYISPLLIENEGQVSPSSPPRIWREKFVAEMAMQLQHEIDKKLREAHEILLRDICENFHYGETRLENENQTGEMTVAMAVADSLMNSTLGLPVPVPLLSAYIVKTEFLDWLCDCTIVKDEEPPNN